MESVRRRARQEPSRTSKPGPKIIAQMILSRWGFDPGNVAEKVADGHDAADPQRAAGHIEKRELPPRHLRHPGDKRRESAHEGHEARRDYGDAAVLFIKRVRLVKAAAVEPARVVPLEHTRADGAADGVVGLVAQNRRHKQQGNHNRIVHQANAAHRTRHKQQRITRQKRHHDDAGFYEHNGEQQRINPDAVTLDEEL